MDIQFPAYPTCQYSSSLFLSQPTSWEISFSHKGHNIHDELMLIQDCIDNYGYHRRQVSLLYDLDQYDN